MCDLAIIDHFHMVTLVWLFWTQPWKVLSVYPDFLGPTGIWVCSCWFSKGGNAAKASEFFNVIPKDTVNSDGAKEVKILHSGYNKQLGHWELIYCPL